MGNTITGYTPDDKYHGPPDETAARLINITLYKSTLETTVTRTNIALLQHYIDHGYIRDHESGARAQRTIEHLSGARW